MDCIRHHVSISIQSEVSFPPKCCNTIWTVEDIPDIVGDDLVEKYRAKKIEYETEDRTYCSNTGCPTNPTFIPSENIQETDATCPRCNEVTCTLCKEKKHSGDCVENEHVEQVLTLATQARWRRCYSCQELIELISGCNHIT